MGETASSHELVLPGKIRVSEHPAIWQTTYLDRPDNKLRLDIRRNNGALDIGWDESIGWRDNPEIGWNHPDVKDLFSKTVAILHENGRDIPSPPTRYATVERLIKNLREQKTPVSLDEQKPKSGDIVVIVGQSDWRLSPRSSTTVYMGKVADVQPTPHKPTIRSLLNKRPQDPNDLSINFLEKEGFRLDYDHFSPEKEHITGGYEWKGIEINKDDDIWYAYMLHGNSGGANDIQAYILDETMFERIKKELGQDIHPATEHVSMKLHGGAAFF